ncbi:ABC transporter ATP-binding protein [Adlercreutzia sp. ZJ304]|uniref:ABC transporter ATP-binding protein n=1 Tax=Adlercreutzia sp. ZJ304 TaxID=2709791 RepID=UPI0013EBFF01|nr:ABC transporter ATP-binding protein [Adlercreutzia sp. ZJ304]
MRVFRYLLEHKAAVLLVLLLLIAQAFCELAIPNLTSNIVDVGIQQSGVEHVATEEMSAQTYDAISDDLSGDSLAVFQEAYEQNDSGRYELTQTGRANLAQLDSIIAKPLAKIYGLTSGADDSMAAQAGISAALKEYSNLGYDLPAMQMGYLVKTGAIMLGIVALGVVFSVIIGLISARTGGKIGRDLRKRLFAKVVNFSDAEISQFSAASLITRGTNDIQLIQNVSFMLLRMVLYAPILAIGGIIMVVATNLEMGWIIAVAVVLVLSLVVVLLRITMPKFKAMQKLIDRVNLVAREILTGLPVVRAFNRQDFEQQRFTYASEKLMRTQLFTNRAMSFMMPAMMLIMNGVSIVIVWFGGLSINAGQLQTGDLIAFITYSMVIIMGFLMLGMIAIMLPRADVAAERVNEVLETKPSVVDVANPVSVSSSNGVKIEFRDVSFRYAADGECALKHISFVAKPGSTLAIVGGTGSGKSTILKLIERFYDTTEGSVLVNDVDVRNMRQSDLRAMFGYVPQRAFLFSGTVKTNVAYANEDMLPSHIEDALNVAQATKFVSEMPDGVDSSIAQGGTNVSGGQRQRLAIARALAADAGALLLDDSFSALDFKTDAALRGALKQHQQNTTCVIVAQRISTVMSADCIVVLDDGRMVGLGTHEHLMASCAEYREIALSQLSQAELAGQGLAS